jgi:hypothetical protein
VKSFWIGCFVIFAIGIPIFVQSQADAYQAGKIVAVDKLSDQQTAGGTDEPLTADVADYNVSIQVGNTVYVCRYQAPSSQEMSGLQDKDVQVRVNGNTMYVKKATGRDAKATIVQRDKATQSQPR